MPRKKVLNKDKEVFPSRFKKTLGSRYLEVLKGSGHHNIIQSEASLKDIIKEHFGKELNNFEDVMEQGKKEYNNKQFFIIYFLRKHRTLERLGHIISPYNISGQQIFNGTAITMTQCPRPMLGVTVFRYSPEKDALELLWALPPQESSIKMLEEAKRGEVKSEERKELVGHILQFVSGELLYKSRKFNNDPALN